VNRIFALVLASVLLAAAACGGSKVAGTYSNENGSIVLDLKAGGTGSLSIAGESKPCTYTVEQAQLKLDCDNNQMVFDIHDDGSLTGPPDSLVGQLKKSS
jgi:hypothetical protein